MAKPGRKSGQPNLPGGREAARERIITAAFETLRQEGFANTSARSISERGGFNQTQIFYYFGSVNELLVAALEWSSLTTLERYRQAVADVATLQGLFSVARERFNQDLESGHLTVIVELISGSTSDLGLKAKVTELFTPWLEFTEATVHRILGDSGMGNVLPSEQVAFGIVALYLGMQQMIYMTGHSDRAAAMFATGEALASLADGFLLSVTPSP